MFVYGNYALISGETALYGFKKHITEGKVIAILIIIGISFGQWNSLTIIMVRGGRLTCFAALRENFCFEPL